MPSYFPNHTHVCCLSFSCTYSASIQFYIQLVLFTVLSCRIPSSYTILPPSGLHVAEMDKKDVSITEICLDPSIFFRMEGIHVNMPCLSILQNLFHLCCSMFYNWSTILLYKACKGKTTMLQSEGLQTRSLQKIQTPGDNKPTPFFIDTAPADSSGHRTSPLQSSKRMSTPF